MATIVRDYSLNGPDSAAAVEAGHRPGRLVSDADSPQSV